MEKITLNNIQSQNPWWNTVYQPEENSWPKRDLFNSLEKNLKNQFILSILGLRRTGKSTIIKQIIGQLLKDKTPPLNIFYFLFDYSLQIKKPDFLNEILAFYLDEVLNQKIYNLKNKVYIFLDEIQYIHNWEAVIKRYYDLSNKKIKFIVSGSQSLLIQNKNKESLAGRIFEFYLPPLSLSEFLMIKKEKISLEKINLLKIEKNFFKISQLNFKHQNKLKKLSQEFILNGQFPECLSIPEEDQRNLYIRESVLGKTLEDIIKLKNIEKNEEFKLTAFQLLNNVSSIFELKNIGQEIGVSYLTLKKYLKYLLDGYLLKILYKEHKSLIKKGRSLKKIYSTTTNFVSALNNYKARHFQEVPEIFGKIIENLVFNTIEKQYSQIYFWRQKEKEVDFIIKNKKQILPIEVKFKQNIIHSDLKNILSYCQHKKINKAIIITKHQLEKQAIKQTNLYFVPYYLLLG